MDLEKYWHDKHIYYSKKDWIDKPSIFSKIAIEYFRKSGIVLDLGAGQGNDSRFFASSGYKVTHLDNSKTAIELAKNKAKAEKLDEIDYCLHDMSEPKLPFEDQQFDIVYANLSIHYFDESTTQNLFAEIYRVLKDGGIFAYQVNSMSDPETREFKKIDDNLYRDPLGLVKRYFTIEYAKEKASNKFETVFLDDTGKIYDRNKPDHLIRFIGKKT